MMETSDENKKRGQKRPEALDRSCCCDSSRGGVSKWLKKGGTGGRGRGQ